MRMRGVLLLAGGEARGPHQECPPWASVANRQLAAAYPNTVLRTRTRTRTRTHR